MINPKILVTGATGKTGGAVVRELLAKGVPVRAMVRETTEIYFQFVTPSRFACRPAAANSL